MSHNLYQNNMAYHGKTPWHKLGVQFDGPMTTDEAIEAARIGFKVERVPLYYKDANDTFAQAPDGYATKNCDTGDLLGYVGARYTPIDVRDELAPIGEILQGESGGRWSTAFAIGRGERVAMMLELPETIRVFSGDDVTKNLLLVTSHDGTLSTQAIITPIRVVCQNTLMGALASGKSIISVKHTKEQKGKLLMAAQILKEISEYYTKLGETFARFAEFKIDDRYLDMYLDALYGRQLDMPAGNARTICERKRNEYNDMFNNGLGVDIPGVDGTLWHAYNAAVEWADYQAPTRGGGDPRGSILFGSGARFKQVALSSALNMLQ